MLWLFVFLIAQLVSVSYSSVVNPTWSDPGYTATWLDDDHVEISQYLSKLYYYNCTFIFPPIHLNITAPLNYSGNATYLLNFTSIESGIEYVRSSINEIIVCLSGGFMLDPVVVPVGPQMKSLTFIGLRDVDLDGDDDDGEVYLRSFDIVPESKYHNPVLVFRELYINKLVVGDHYRSKVFPTVIFDNVHFEVPLPDSHTNFFLSTRVLYILNSFINNTQEADFVINLADQLGVRNGSVVIDGLIMENSVITYGIQISHGNQYHITNSVFRNNTISGESFMLWFDDNTVPSFLNISNVTFDDNTWSNSKGLIHLFQSGTILLSDITVICSPDRPFKSIFANTLSNITTNNITLDPSCNTHCEDPSSFSPFDLFPCKSCPEGMVPLSNQCRNCTPGSFSYLLECSPCPPYSIQSEEGKPYCLCMGLTLIRDPGSRKCSTLSFLTISLLLFVVGLLLLFTLRMKTGSQPWDTYRSIILAPEKEEIEER